MRRILSFIFLAFSLAAGAQTMPTVLGETFPDTDGKHINCHGGNIIRADGKFYWYGEHRGESQEGVACYSSDNLRDWKNEGIVLRVVDEPGALLERGCTIERPKVVYNPLTGKYVMWIHLELKGRGYEAAFAGTATSDSPTGPFEFLGASRVNPGYYPMGESERMRGMHYDPKLEWWTPEWRKTIEDGSMVVRDLPGGQMARDMTVFVDDDQKAYHIYSSEDNLTLHVADLDSTYTRHTGVYSRIAPGGHNEAPTIFKRDGRYWLITSGCTGWAPNKARMMWADSIHGPWHQVESPFKGEGADTTFGSQGTYILDLDGRLTFMADIWNPRNLADSRHLWLPIELTPDGPVIRR